MASLKFDENMPDLASAILSEAGHDVSFARDENLAGMPDEHILATAAREGRAVVTLDVGFANIRRHPPTDTAGVVLIRSKDLALPSITPIIGRLAELLTREPVAGHLWVITANGLRIWPADT